MTTLTVDADHINIDEHQFTFGEPCPDRRHYIMRPSEADPLGLRRNNVHDDVRCRERCSNAPDGARRLITGSTPCSAVIVMDGEGCAHCRDTGDTSDGRPCWKCNGRGYHDRPPEQVRRLNGPCSMCGGEYDEAFQWRDWQTVERIQDCPDCHNGKPTFTLHQRCEHGMTQALAISRGAVCSKCRNNGVIDLGDGWIITDVLPRADNQYAILCEQETQQ